MEGRYENLIQSAVVVCDQAGGQSRSKKNSKPHEQAMSILSKSRSTRAQSNLNSLEAMISCRGHEKGHYLMTNVWAIQANIFFVLPQEISMIIAVEQLIPLHNVIISRSCMISLSSTLGKEIVRDMKALQCEAEHGRYT